MGTKYERGKKECVCRGIRKREGKTRVSKSVMVTGEKKDRIHATKQVENRNA